MRLNYNHKRSVSPFGQYIPKEDPFEELKKAFKAALPEPLQEPVRQLKLWADASSIPSVIDDIAQAPANDAPQLGSLCEYLVKHLNELAQKGLDQIVYRSMEDLFNLKTEVFLVDHYDRNFCARMGWAEESRDNVLFAKERDILVVKFFAPVSERTPGEFSSFVKKWMETSSSDRSLHLVDFCVGSQKPTLDHYLLFTHPTLARLVREKAYLRSIFDKARPILDKLSSPTWEKEAKKTLDL